MNLWFDPVSVSASQTVSGMNVWCRPSSSSVPPDREGRPGSSSVVPPSTKHQRSTAGCRPKMIVSMDLYDLELYAGVVHQPLLNVLAPLDLSSIFLWRDVPDGSVWSAAIRPCRPTSGPKHSWEKIVAQWLSSNHDTGTAAWITVVSFGLQRP
ncbi:hypothetical protein VTN77DRAFT_2521 [Rasamsonia byssochlamydoides]|uniref:uncharacterized protein n=1 Tax=Rasamsonia byssochlamydoides TaxID=89139 RepID=UPI0037440BEF